MLPGRRGMNRESAKKGEETDCQDGEATLEVADQKRIKAWIGQNEPDKYIKFFGEVEEG